jgi:hypothetical protein
MFSSIKSLIVEKLFKSFLVDIIIKNLDKLLSKLPENEKKTITGALIAVIAFLVSQAPEAVPYVGGILDWLKTLPTAEIQEGGLWWAVVGLSHKVIKYIVDKFGSDDSTGLIKRKEEVVKEIDKAVKEAA